MSNISQSIILKKLDYIIRCNMLYMLCLISAYAGEINIQDNSVCLTPETRRRFGNMRPDNPHASAIYAIQNPKLVVNDGQPESDVTEQSDLPTDPIKAVAHPQPQKLIQR